jgi:hypothetical protein
MSIVRRAPFFDVPTHVDVAGQSVLVRPFQLVVWVSIEARGRLSPRLPAILDTGFSLNFAIQEEHLRSWADLSPDTFRVIGRSRINQQELRLYEASIAIHPNAAGQRDVLRGAEPYHLHVREGIVVYHRGSPLGPRLPLLGLRALVQNSLETVIDGQRRELTIRRKRRLFRGW